VKFCIPHWKRLRDAIESRGLMPLVARNGKEAAEALAVQMDDAPLDGKKASYDPLMDCTLMVYKRAMDLGGLYMLTGEKCPVCEAVKFSAYGEGEREFRDAAHVERHWIDGPADSVLQFVQQDPELSALLAALKAGT
jgi:hypothetical protein